MYTSPVYDGNVVLAMGGYFGASLAVKPGGSGDVTAKRLWHEARAKKNRLATPVMHEGHAYFVNMSGFMTCLDLKTGGTVYTERLPATKSDPGVWGSPVLVGDRVYVTNQSGDTHVVRASPKFELLASNPVGEYSNSSLGGVGRSDLPANPHEPVVHRPVGRRQVTVRLAKRGNPLTPSLENYRPGSL